MPTAHAQLGARAPLSHTCTAPHPQQGLSEFLSPQMLLRSPDSPERHPWPPLVPGQAARPPRCLCQRGLTPEASINAWETGPPARSPASTAPTPKTGCLEHAGAAQHPRDPLGKDTTPTASPYLLQGLGEAPPGVQSGAMSDTQSTASINIEKYSTVVWGICTVKPRNTQLDFVTDREVTPRVCGAGGQPDSAHHAGNAGEGS